MPRRRRRRTWSTEAQEQLAGFRALYDGVCDLCPEPILVDQRVMRRKNGLIHVTCSPGWQE